METAITDGKINLKGNFVFRETPKRADYILYLSENNPIAVVESKDNNHSVSHGLQQAMTYAQMLDVPFAYSSNGDGFAEHDFLTGQEREFGLDEFPTEQELIARFKQESGLTSLRKLLFSSPTIPARTPIRRDITSATPSTVQWMPLPGDSSGFYW
ncbi:MAG: type I restriction enzyme HsdR N-terminal domain-containing protein [Oscillospiraceae bacterium]